MHVGNLRAIHSNDEFEVRGYAGTSAGAIVAALAATGWKPSELVDVEEGSGAVSSAVFEALQQPNAGSLPMQGPWRTFSKPSGKN